MRCLSEGLGSQVRVGSRQRCEEMSMLKDISGHSVEGGWREKGKMIAFSFMD